MDTIRVGILTSSDRAFNQVYEDLSGVEIKKVLGEYCANPLEIHYKLLPDEQVLIEKALIELCDELNCDLVVTTGGTGPSLRDVTTEATEAVCQKLLPGFGELMRSVSLKVVPTAILSRQTAGVRNKSLIVNLPGKPKAIRECLSAVFPAVPYCIDLIGGRFIVNKPESIQVFRPKN
ncbi:MAG: molybdopterin adenylyltransferase [Cytophagales bacterium]